MSPVTPAVKTAQFISAGGLISDGLAAGGLTAGWIECKGGLILWIMTDCGLTAAVKGLMFRGVEHGEILGMADKGFECKRLDMTLGCPDRDLVASVGGANNEPSRLITILVESRCRML